MSGRSANPPIAGNPRLHTPTGRPGLSTEVALCNASDILESAAVGAYDCAEHLDGASRKQVLAVVQLLVDEALNRECPVA